MLNVVNWWRQTALTALLLLIVGCSSAASATNVRLVGSVGYSCLGTIVLLTADQVHNFDATGNSGALRLELWATPTPFSGSFTGGYQLTAYNLGTLPAGATLTNIQSGALLCAPPPSGMWYVSIVLTEQTGTPANGGFSAASYVNFEGKIAGSGPPPSDTTPPVVSIASPTSGNVSGTVTISANASDNVGVTRVDFYVNGALVGSDSATPYQCSWNTTALANGTASIYAKAFDAAGHSTQSATVTVNVNNVVAPPPDTTPPTVSIASPTSGNVSVTTTISANASDNVGVTRVDFYINGAFVGSDSAAPYQYSWNTTSAPMARRPCMPWHSTRRGTRPNRRS